MKVRFLLDENLSPKLRASLWRHSPLVDVLRVGDPEAPPLGTLDPDILRYLEHDQRALVTNNRISMPKHLQDHYAAGGQHWGVFSLTQGATFGAVLETLIIIWEVSEAEEWINQTRWIPF